MPSLRVMPNSFQKVAYLSGSFSASSASRRSLESMTPRMNRRNSRVPDLAIVPMFAITSSQLIPTPLSAMVIVPASLS